MTGLDGSDEWTALAARQSMRALTDGADAFERFFDHVVMGLAMADLSTRYLRVNTSYAGLLGRTPEDLVGVALLDVVRSDQGDLSERLRRLLAREDAVLVAEERYLGPSGRELWVMHTVTLVVDDQGRPEWFAIGAQDVTERRRAEEGLRDLTATLAERAVRDPLTGLANRVLLEERLRGSLARDGRTGSSTSVLFLDLNRFKPVNDRYGHAVGDEVLKEVARRLVCAVRPSDTVARPGGDEFVVLAEGTDETTVSALVTRLEEAVRAPLTLRGLDLSVGVSIGVAVSHRGEADSASLLAEADRAMYVVKHGARRAR